MASAKRKAAGKKAAATRKRNKAKRSKAAKKGARKKARKKGGRKKGSKKRKAKRTGARVALGMRAGYKHAGKGQRTRAVTREKVQRCPPGKTALMVGTAKVKKTKGGRTRVHYAIHGRCISS